MIDKKTVFVLGAGASCPYGYPSGARLREWICLQAGFRKHYDSYLGSIKAQPKLPINEFIDKFTKSSRQSIDLFMATNPKLAPTAKYIIAFAIFEAEKRSGFREQAKMLREWYSRSRPEYRSEDFVEKGYFQGEDWYFYLFNQLTSDVLPDFSDEKISFITFNYNRSLEQFLYESLSHSFTAVPEPDVSECLKKLKILHVYGQIAPLKWQDPKQGVDYKPNIEESLLERTAANIKTIHEQEESPESNEIQNLFKKAEQIFFLGFGYAPENMKVLNLIKTVSPAVQIYGTAFNREPNEINNIQREIDKSIPATSTGYKHQYNIKVENMDCLKLLRNYL